MAKSSRFKSQTQRKRTSKGEEEVYRIIEELFPLVVKYTEYPYVQIIDDEDNSINNKLKADIYIKTFNTVIEYNHKHHYAPVFYGNSEEEIADAKEKFEHRKSLDAEKRRLCEDYNINLIEIDFRIWNKLKTKEEKKEWLLDRF